MRPECTGIDKEIKRDYQIKWQIIGQRSCSAAQKKKNFVTNLLTSKHILSISISVHSHKRERSRDLPNNLI